MKMNVDFFAGTKDKILLKHLNGALWQEFSSISSPTE